MYKVYEYKFIEGMQSQQIKERVIGIAWFQANQSPGDFSILKSLIIE